MKVRVKNNAYWVGKTDWELRRFHGDEYSTHRGSTYNSYLIQEEKTALIDTVWAPFAKEYVDNLAEEIDLKKLDYVIVTCSNYCTKTCLEKSLDKMNITYVKLGTDIKKWRHKDKINLLINFLRKCKAKYVIALDAVDVLMTSHPDIAIKRFINMNQYVLFNAEDAPSPLINRLTASLSFEKSFDGYYRHLNAGSLIGDRISVLEMYEMASRYPFLKYTNNDQEAIRWAFPRVYPKMDIDRKCKIFQIYKKDVSARINGNTIIFGKND